MGRIARPPARAATQGLQRGGRKRNASARARATAPASTAPLAKGLTGPKTGSSDARFARPHTLEGGGCRGYRQPEPAQGRPQRDAVKERTAAPGSEAPAPQRVRLLVKLGCTPRRNDSPTDQSRNTQRARKKAARIGSIKPRNVLLPARAKKKTAGSRQPRQDRTVAEVDPPPCDQRHEQDRHGQDTGDGRQGCHDLPRGIVLLLVRLNAADPAGGEDDLLDGAWTSRCSAGALP